MTDTTPSRACGGVVRHGRVRTVRRARGTVDVMHDDGLPALVRALHNLDAETRHALSRALARDDCDLEGGDWGVRDDGSGCLLSLAAWELGLDRGEELMVRSIDAVRVPALFDAWWATVVAREGDVPSASRSARDVLRSALAGAERRDAVDVEVEPVAGA